MSGDAQSDIEEYWTTLLAAVYRSVDWRRIRGRNPLDVFEHRLRFASYEKTVARVLDRLMLSLGLQAPRLPQDAIVALEKLRERDREAVRFLRRHVKLLVYLAWQKARSARVTTRGSG